jgi:hypothetical protein
MSVSAKAAVGEAAASAVAPSTSAMLLGMLAVGKSCCACRQHGKKQLPHTLQSMLSQDLDLSQLV